MLVTAEEDRRWRVLTRQITSFWKVGGLYRRDHEMHQLHPFRRSTLAEHLRSIGFRVRILSDYRQSRFARGLVGFLAYKASQP